MRARSTFLAALALVLTGALASCGSDSSSDGSSATDSEQASDASDAANVISVSVIGDKITPEPGKVPIPVGEAVTIKVTSDVKEEVHIHGYDKRLDLEPGVENMTTLTADIPGVFEVELEDSGTVLFELEVS